MTTLTPFFREVGSGPPVICLHASASSSGQWRPLLETLSGRFRAIAPDRYGHGQSPAWSGGREVQLEDEIALLAPLLETAGQFHLIGHSYGGLVAMKLALTHPNQVASLTLYEPTCFFLLTGSEADEPASREIRAVRDKTNRLVEAGDLAAAAQHFIDYWLGPGAWAHTPETRRLAIAGSMAKVRLEWPHGFAPSLSAAQISSLSMPILLLTGSRSPTPARAVSGHLQRLLPAAEVVEFPEMGHMGPVTNPARVNEAIAAFLARMAAVSPASVV